jgi:hypothetical protein
VLDWKHISPCGLSCDIKFDGLGFATLAFNNISGAGIPLPIEVFRP